MTLTFDPLIVNTTTVVAGDFNGNSSPDYSNVSDGVLRVTVRASRANLTGDLTIATVTLEAVGASGSCELGLSAELSNKSGGDVLPSRNNGTFTISTTLFNTINVTPAGPLTKNVGETQAFTAVCYNNTTELTVTVTWNSSNTTVGTITSGGVFTAAVNGTTTITATAQGVTSNTVSVTVNADNLIDRYDTDNDGVISKDEAIAAISDYFEDKISKEDALEVIMAYFG